MLYTYKEYTDLGGKLEDTAFTPLEMKAELLLNYWTQDRLKGVKEIPQEVKILLTEMVDSLNTELREVKSFSNDGVSVTYSDKSIEQALYDKAVAYLPAELVYIGGVYSDTNF